MEVSDELHALDALSLRKEIPLPSG